MRYDGWRGQRATSLANAVDNVCCIVWLAEYTGLRARFHGVVDEAAA